MNKNKIAAAAAAAAGSIVIPDGRWQNWNVKRDIYDRNDHSQLTIFTDYLWKCELPSNTAKVFSFAKEKNENLIYFATLFVRNDKVFFRRDNNLLTLLHTIVEWATPDLCQLVLESCKPCVDIYDKYGNTPYHYAAAAGRHDVLRILCGQTVFASNQTIRQFTPQKFCLPGKSVGERNSKGWSPSHLAIMHPNSTIHLLCFTTLVTIGGVDASARRGVDGCTVAHIALRNKDIICLERVLNIGCDPEVTNGCGISSLEEASKLGNDYYNLCNKYNIRKLLDNISLNPSGFVNNRNEEYMEID